MAVKPYSDVVQELWDAARDNVTIAGLQLAHMPGDQDPITIQVARLQSEVSKLQQIKS